MEWKKLVVIILLGLTLQSCHLLFIKYNETEYGSYRPKKNNFKIGQNPYRLKIDDIIDTNSIYVKIDSAYFKSAITLETNLQTANAFLRFFPDGRYIESTTKKSFADGLEDYNNLKKGIVGYYKIEDNELSLEYFLANAHNYGKYYNYELKIIGDSIEGYKKIEIEGLTGTPDW